MIGERARSGERRQRLPEAYAEILHLPEHLAVNSDQAAHFLGMHYGIKREHMQHFLDTKLQAGAECQVLFLQDNNTLLREVNGNRVYVVGRDTSTSYQNQARQWVPGPMVVKAVYRV